MRRNSNPTSTGCLALALCILTATAVAAADENSAAFARDVQPVLKKHCFACHGPEKQEARIRYDQVESFRFDDRHLWTKVHEMISAGEMPPDERPQLTAAERKTVLQWIEQQSSAAAREHGAGSTRRLNRRELAAALRDLTGLAVDYADGLPGDGKIDGFDTGAAALQDAASSVAQVMNVTRRAVDGIRFLEPPQGVVFSADLRDVKDVRKALDAWKSDGANPKTRGFGKPGVGLHLESKWVGERGGIEIFVPPAADGNEVLRLNLTVCAQKYVAGLPNPHLWVTVGGKAIDYREISAPADAPQQLVYEVQLDDLAIDDRGVNIDLSARIELPYGVDDFPNEDKTKPEDKIPGGPGLFRPAFDRKKLPPEEQPVPFVVLQHIKIEPNYVAAWPPPAWQADVGDVANDLQTADRLLALWIERAWRRPVGQAERERFLALYKKLRGEQMTFDDALRATFHSVLLSAPFRYLAAPGDADRAAAQYAIASRLSFLLWGAPPDDELLSLAAAGKLRDPAVLDAQVDRLLADPRSDAFLRPFVVQWLELEQPITLVMDYFQKQDFRFGRHLKESMREETIAYIAQLSSENRPVKELIASDWTMMNESLARHYGYDGIEGAQLRKVKLRKNDPRGGGVFSHAGIQSMLCWMGDNWVIYRGAWTLRHILDDPPPPPPLEVPELDPTAGDNRGKTFKQLLVQHQANSKCAVCHQKMDPLGFAFQNFDISGRWREVEHESYTRNELDGKIEWRGAGKTRPVDAVGRLPRGEEFSSYGEFKEIVAKNYLKAVARGLLKRFMIYAAGHRPDIQDTAEIKRILDEQAAAGYRMKDLLKAIVRSRAFLEN